MKIEMADKIALLHQHIDSLNRLIIKLNEQIKVDNRLSAEQQHEIEFQGELIRLFKIEIHELKLKYTPEELIDDTVYDDKNVMPTCFTSD